MDTLTPRTYTSGRSQLVAFDFGAHLAQWSVDGVTRVWLSEQAVLDGSRAIRGGVPICFPWFADGPDGHHKPAHGIVRTARWRRVKTRGVEIWAWEIVSEDVVDSPGAGHLPGPFHARYAVSLEPHEDDELLTVALTVTNTGDEDYRAEMALHTYLAVDDVRQVRILGLERAPYLDKVTGRREVQSGPVEVQGETDRVFDRTGPVIVEDRAALRHYELRPEGATQTVVWNPWAGQAARLPDLGPDEWLRFVCVETVASGERALTVPARGTVRISCAMTQSHTPAR